MFEILRDVDKITKAKSPYDIFSMMPSSLDTEYEAYEQLLKPRPYHVVENFVALQNVTLLYCEAKKLLDGEALSSVSGNAGSLHFVEQNGAQHDYVYTYHSNFRIGDMYSCRDAVIYVVKDRKYYFNYIDKANVFADPGLWKEDIASMAKYIFPKIDAKYVTDSGDYVIVVNKPYTAYPLRQICEYLGHDLLPEHIAAIATRLCLFIALINIDAVDIQHNAICLDNIFFAPGRNTDGKEESYELEDARFVGVYGGWFFSTYRRQELFAIPMELKGVVTHEMMQSGFSSFAFDELATKKLVRELFECSGKKAPRPIEDWFNDGVCLADAYEEFQSWERAKRAGFGPSKFVEMSLGKI